MWWLPAVMAVSCYALSSDPERNPDLTKPSKRVIKVSAGGNGVALLLGALLPANAALLSCLDDGPIDEVLDLIVWLCVTVAMISLFHGCTLLSVFFTAQLLRLSYMN